MKGKYQIIKSMFFAPDKIVEKGLSKNKAEKITSELNKSEKDDYVYYQYKLEKL